MQGDETYQKIEQLLHSASPQTKELFFYCLAQYELDDKPWSFQPAPDDNPQFEAGGKTLVKQDDNLVVSRDEYKIIARYHRLHTMIHQCEESYTEQVSRKMDELLDSLDRETCEEFLDLIAQLEDEWVPFRVEIALDDYQISSDPYPLLFTT